MNFIKSISTNLKLSGAKRKFIFIFVILEMILTAVSVLYPSFIGKIISITTTNKNANSYKELWHYTILFLVILVFWLTLGYFNRMFIVKQNQLALSSLRKRILAAFFIMPEFVKQKNGTGYYQDRILKESNHILNFFYIIWGRIFSSVATVLITMAIMLYISPILTLLSMIILPFSSYVAKRASKKIYDYTTANNERDAKVSEFYQECFKTDKTILVYHLQAKVLSKIDFLVDKFIDKLLKLRKISYLSSIISETLGYYINSLLVLIYGGYLVLEGKLNIGVWVTFYYYPMYLWGAIEELFRYYYDLIKYNASWNRINEILKFEKDVYYQDYSIDTVNSLNCKNLSFSYEENKVIFENFNYRFTAGKIYLIRGESGKGKTTLLKLLSAQIKPTKGVVLLNNEIVFDKFPTQNSNFKIGFLFQKSDIFSDSIKNNIIGNLSFDKEKFQTVVSKSKLTKLIASLPDKENSLVAESGSSLSGGQIQRIGIARMLYQESNIWFLDEPTTALDVQNEADIMQIIKENSQGKIVICVSHKKIMEKIADSIVTL